MEVIKGDITKIKVDAIVNAANNRLLGGDGVDGAIHKAGGKEILEECIKIGGCPTGKAVVTTAGLLDAKYVIHTVGPVWHDGCHHEETLLRNCYVNSIELALKYNCQSIAFPNISTGIYRFPKEKAAQIALDAIRPYMDKIKILFVCFDDKNYELYRSLKDNE